MDKFYIHTLGCKVNQAETDMIAEELAQKGLQAVDLDQDPDWCIMNTCTVTAAADKKARQAVRKVKKTCPQAKLVVTGCFAELHGDYLKKEGVHVVLGNQDKMAISALIKKQKGSPAPMVGHARPLVKVQDGCRQNCSYCIVPAVRGGYRSTPPQEVVARVNRAACSGYGEVVLTGIHLGKYGVDLGKDCCLEDLVCTILDQTPIGRIRLSAVEIAEVTEGLLDLMAGQPQRICSHLHIPLQSGSNKILHAMGRPYSREFFLTRVEKIRQILPDVALTTDVMVGFPKESEDDYRLTAEAVREISFSKLHVFQYSKRKGTSAAELDGQIPAPIKKNRSRHLSQLGNTLRARFLQNNTGKRLAVVLEQIDGGLGRGTSENYIRVSLNPAPGMQKGKIYDVLAKSVSGKGLRGTIFPN